MNENIIEATGIRDSHTIASEINILTRQAQSMALYFICEIGRRLKEAKAMLNHGEWGEWLEHEVSYSQSTAENYMRIQEEYGNEQVSLFGVPNSQAFENLEYTKLVALIAIPAAERADFAEQVDAEHISTRELQEKIKELQLEKEQSELEKREMQERLDQQNTHNKLKQELILREKEDAEKKAQEEARKVEALENRIKELEKAEPEVSEDMLAGLRAEAEKAAKANLQKKLDAAKEKQKKAEQRVKDKEAELEEQKKALQAVADEKDAEVKKAEERAEALAKELKLAGSQETVKFKLLFSAVQNNFRDLVGCLEKIEDAETKNKLTAALKAVLENMKEQVE